MFDELSRRRLIFVTGKGGTGKTTLVTALGLYLASQDRRVLLAEVDNARPTLGGYFDRDIGFTPVRVAANLDAVNLDFFSALRAFLERVVPMERLVRLILRNRIVRTFLLATPGARETAVLGRIRTLARDVRTAEGDGDDGATGGGWDHLIVDMPASGHAVSTFATPATVQRLFRVGPIRKEADILLEQLSDPDEVALVMVSISEEMSINETIETIAKVRASGWPPLAGVVLNRFPQTDFDGDDAALLGALAGDGALDGAPGNAAAVIEAAHGALIEQRRSAEALRRLEREVGGQVCRLPFVRGGPVEVARKLAQLVSDGERDADGDAGGCDR